MHLQPTWKTVTDYFSEFCLYVHYLSVCAYILVLISKIRNDTEFVDRNGVMERVKSIFQGMLEPSENRIITTRRELHISKHVSVVISRDTDQLLALSETVKKQCGPELHSESALENLSVFTMPGESLLIHVWLVFLLRTLSDYLYMSSYRKINSPSFMNGSVAIRNMSRRER